MARPQSRAKAGHYPTPPEMTEIIAQYLAAPPAAPAGDGATRCRLFDPCCGDGSAAGALGKKLVAETYGVELSAERAKRAGQILSHVITGDALHMKCAPASFGALFLNPPYDTSDDSLQRLEFAFLKKTVPYLHAHGILVLIVPQHVLGFERMSVYLSRWFSDLSVFRFSDLYFAAYSQVVVFGIKRGFSVGTFEMEASRDLLLASSRCELPDIADLSTKRCYSVPGIKPGAVQMEAPALDLAAAVLMLREGGGLMGVCPEFVAETRPDGGGEVTLRPLMPLKKGHLSLLLASGLVKNIVVRKNGSTLLIKGRQFKKDVPVESHNEDTTIMREQIVVELRTLDLRSGKMTNIRHGDGEEG